MIVVDFIDMDRPHNREKVTRSFNEYLRKDRSKAAVTRISELGLIEMTRKRTRESLLHTLTEPCTSCEGKGYTKSRKTVTYELFRELRRQGDLVEGDTVLVEVHPDVAQVLGAADRPFLEEMEKRLQKRIVVKARGSFHVEDFEIRSPNDKAPIEKSEIAGAAREDSKDGPREGKRRRRRRRHLGPPAEVEAALAEDEANAIDPESMAARGDDDGADGQTERPPRRRRGAGERRRASVGRPIPSERRDGAGRPMVRICFVCLGNICRSPTAEAVMRHLVKQAGLGDQIAIDSAGTGDWHVGHAARSPQPGGRPGARDAALGRGPPVHAGRLRRLRLRAGDGPRQPGRAAQAGPQRARSRQGRAPADVRPQRAARRRGARPVLRRRRAGSTRCSTSASGPAAGCSTS